MGAVAAGGHLFTGNVPSSFSIGTRERGVVRGGGGRLVPFLNCRGAESVLDMQKYAKSGKAKST